MPQTALQLNVGPVIMPAFMIGAQVLSILAWPTCAEMGPFHKVSQELMAEVLRQTKRSDPAAIDRERARWPQYDWNALLAMSDKRRMATGSLRKRLKQRMVAAKIAIGMAHDELFGQPARLPPSLTGLSIDQLAGLVKQEVFINDADKVEKLVWRKSLPIIHLAISVQNLLKALGGDEQSGLHDTQDIDFFRPPSWRRSMIGSNLRLIDLLSVAIFFGSTCRRMGKKLRVRSAARPCITAYP